MKPQPPNLIEGHNAFERFKTALKTVLSVPKSALPPRPHREMKKATKTKA